MKKPICPYCEKKISVEDVGIDVENLGKEGSKPLSQFSGNQIKLGMVYCPNCGKVLSFIYG